jgi:dihydrofolate synthase/folylpolyglutamate synthase
VRTALDRLYALGPGQMRAGRERLRRLLERAGDPQLAVPSILVGGTNGKGMVVAALSAVLSQSCRAGSFLKPHLKSITERWRIADRDVDAVAFAAVAHRALDLIEAHGEPISFFEANVLIGALLFQKAECDVVIWEIGLGGREDACNLVDPLVSVLTNVGYDHQAILGESLAEIARDKAQICRAGRPLVLGPPRPGWESAYDEYASVVAEVCLGRGGLLVPLRPCEEREWNDYSRRGGQGVPPDAAAVARRVVDELGHAGLRRLLPASQALEAGLARVRYRARMEQCTLGGQPALVDAAHNVDSLRWLARVLDQRARGKTYPVIFGCQATHDPLDLLRELGPRIDVLVPIEVPVMRPCPLRSVIDAAAGLGISVSLPAEVELGEIPHNYELGANNELDPPDNRTRWIECVEHGLTLASAGRPAVVCGSIYYVGEILRHFER